MSNPASFHSEARYQGKCQHPDCEEPLTYHWHAHHVVYRQHVEAHGGNVWDTRNAMRLCNRLPHDCHRTKHHNRKAPVPMSVVRDETIEFAVEVMGPGRTINFFERFYASADDDTRLNELREAA